MTTMTTPMINTPCPGAGRRFVVEASNSDPAAHHGLGRGNRRDNLTDITTVRLKVEQIQLVSAVKGFDLRLIGLQGA